MSKLQSLGGFMKMFWAMMIDEWNEMDHRLVKIATGVISFIAAALFWLLFLKNIVPF